MKILFLDLRRGVAGDMFSGALFALLSPDNQKEALDKLNACGIPKTTLSLRHVQNVFHGEPGLHAVVRVAGQQEKPAKAVRTKAAREAHGVATEANPSLPHSSASLADIKRIIDQLSLDPAVRESAFQIYSTIADAESQAHNQAVGEVHFHELGAADAIMDVSAAAYLMHRLNCDRVVATPVNTGSGMLECAHGILPVPAPATAILLKGIPSFSDQTQSELCTPTGAALIKYFVDEFSEAPKMRVEKCGWGFGTKKFPGKTSALHAVFGTS